MAGVRWRSYITITDSSDELGCSTELLVPGHYWEPPVAHLTMVAKVCLLAISIAAAVGLCFWAGLQYGSRRPGGIVLKRRVEGEHPEE